MNDGFAWGCGFGRTSVVDFPLQRGTELDAKRRHDGQTGLHGAAIGGHVDSVKLLPRSRRSRRDTDELFAPHSGRCKNKWRRCRSTVYLGR